MKKNLLAVTAFAVATLFGVNALAAEGAMGATPAAEKKEETKAEHKKPMHKKAMHKKAMHKKPVHKKKAMKKHEEKGKMHEEGGMK